MDSRLNLILVICILCFVAVTARTARSSGDWRLFFIRLVVLAGFAAFLHHWFGFPLTAPVLSKGDGGLLLAGALAISMIAGMFAQYLYKHFEKPKRNRQKWDWGRFVSPVFASPIVLIPLIAAFQSVDIDLAKDQMTLPRLMVFLVAFENGFFWNEHFDRRSSEVHKGE